MAVLHGRRVTMGDRGLLHLETVTDLVDGARHHHAPPFQNPYRRADVGELAQDVRRQQDGLPKRLQVKQQVADFDTRTRVEIAGRLVQDEHLRVVQEDARQLQPLLLALGQRHHQLVFQRADVGQLEHRVHDAQ